MSYYDWEHLSKPFRFQPVIQDTTENTKALSITPVDFIKTGSVFLKLPAAQFTPYKTTPAFGALITPLIVGQYNFSVGSVITLTDTNNATLNDALTFYLSVLVVRFRVGTEVKRYRISNNLLFNLPPLGQSAMVGTHSLPFPIYTSQPISGNFVIEVWQVASVPVGYLCGSVVDVYLKTGKIYFPTSYEDTGYFLTPSQIVDLPQLQTALPATDDNYDVAGPWLDNP